MRGGKRPGAGRPQTGAERCACGQHTLVRATQLKLGCRRVQRAPTWADRFTLLKGRDPAVANDWFAEWTADIPLPGTFAYWPESRQIAWLDQHYPRKD